MSNNDLALFGGAVPAHIKAGANKALLDALAGQPAGKRLSIKGGVFRLIVGGKEIASIEERRLPVVIVAAAEKVSRTYYPERYSEEQVAAPKCWSQDGLKPDADVSDPQSNACATCPQNIKGSGDNDSRACRYSQRIAVVLENDMAGDVLQMSIPATSLFGKEEGGKFSLQAYARVLSAQSVSPDMVVTELSFDTKAPVPKLFFKPVRYLTEEEYNTAKAQGASDDARQAVTFTVAKQDNVPHPEPAADFTSQPPMVTITTAPKAEKEPKKREAEKPAVVPSDNKNIAGLLAEWDDEA